jgi:hypothetical protein
MINKGSSKEDEGKLSLIYLGSAAELEHACDHILANNLIPNII